MMSRRFKLQEAASLPSFGAVDDGMSVVLPAGNQMGVDQRRWRMMMLDKRDA